MALEDKLVENWLSSVEEAMKKALRELLNRALLEYNRVPLLEWIASYPSQVSHNTRIITRFWY